MQKLFIIVITCLIAAVMLFVGYKHVNKTSLSLNPSDTFVIETSLGDVHIKLYKDKSPQTVAHFLRYVEEGFYTNILIHRIIPGKIVQTGGYIKDLALKKATRTVINESNNGLRNSRGTIAMARNRDADSASSQFFFNLQDNVGLDATPEKAGYAVFAKVTKGLEIIESMARQPVVEKDGHKNVPNQDLFVLSIHPLKEAAVKHESKTKENEKQEKPSASSNTFIEGQHYQVLKEPVPQSNSKTIEVTGAFSYGCGHCFGIEPYVEKWKNDLSDDVKFKRFPAVWNQAMALYAKAFYIAHELNLSDKAHVLLSTAIVVDQVKLSTPEELADFFSEMGADRQQVLERFLSSDINDLVEQTKLKTKQFNLGSVPEFIVNGKYRVSPMMAGSQEKVFDVLNFLIEQEKKQK